jgi:hypothetical protein
VTHGGAARQAAPRKGLNAMIKRKGVDEPVFLDLLSLLTEPLHYLLLLPHGTMGWSPSRLMYIQRQKI